MRFSLPRRAQKGQALLLILLVMAISLAAVLAAVSRSVSDISVTEKNEDSLRAFNAAEAAIEYVLQDPFGNTSGPSLGQGITTNVAVSLDPLTNPREYAYPKDITSGESATFWFVAHDTSGTSADPFNCTSTTCYINSGDGFEICWGDGTSSESPAIEVSLYYDSGAPQAMSGNFSGLRVSRRTFDPNIARSGNNGFAYTSSDCNSGNPVDGQSFTYSTGIINNWGTVGPPYNVNCAGSGCFIMARIRMFYNAGDSQPIAIRVPSGTLPSQALLISSTGRAEQNSVPLAARRIEVRQNFAEPPFVFDSALFSYQDIRHN